MNAAAAKLLRTGDRVLWTWTEPPSAQPAVGTVLVANRESLTIQWLGQPSFPTKYLFTDPDPWPHLETPPDPRVYYPIERPRRISRRCPKARP